MRYDIEADWQLLNTCNYRCPYCFFPSSLLGEKLTVYGTPEVWRQAFDQTGLTWLLNITGGEPTIYPGFASLCQLLTIKHYLSFNTNLTHPSIVDVANRVDPARVKFINAGLHAEERTRRKGLKLFLKNAACLKESNFPIFVSIVATPEVLSQVDKTIALTETVGFIPIPKLLRGPYKGRLYPQAYSASERATFIQFAARAQESYDSTLQDLPYVFGDEKYVEGIPAFTGRMCGAGSEFIRLEADGKIYRCEVKESNYLGNILNNSFVPRTVKTPCDSEYCFYFCLRYSDFTRFPKSPARSNIFGRFHRSALQAIRSVVSARS